MVKRLTSAFLALALVLSLIVSLGSFTVSADETETVGLYIAEKIIREELKLKTIESKTVGSYRKIELYRNGELLKTDARLINGMTYVALRSFINETVPEAEVRYNSKTKTVTVSGTELEITATDASYVVDANGRALFTVSPSVIMTNGRMYVPISTMAKALSLSLVPGGVKIDVNGRVAPILTAEKYYRDDAVYWMSRIISAESRGEGLYGQIAVGNVVLNRVDSSLYPNTIWGVIFDKKYGVQFSPILDGSIYNTPTESSILAAKIALEGYRVSDRVMFFLAPKYAQSSWIPNTRTYEFTIGTHDFYS